VRRNNEQMINSFGLSFKLDEMNGEKKPERERIIGFKEIFSAKRKNTAMNLICNFWIIVL
jgi:hypothetical protein